MLLKEYATTFLSYLKRPSKRKLIRVSLKFHGKKGLEIGGPSSFFSLKGYCPVYVFAAQIDGVNYSNQTLWEGKIEEGYKYKYYKKTGYQFIDEATDLRNCGNEIYDFVLSCHSLEHVANPLKALKELNRVLKKEGTMILVLPDKRFTFDSARSYTTMDHLKKDFENDVSEDDSTHFEEFISLYKRDADPAIPDMVRLRQQVLQNSKYRCVHHHVFSVEVVNQMLEFSGFKLTFHQEAPPFHLVFIAKKFV